jgi:pimeloyl-ACP methyl ester carboxylesterase
VTSGKLEGVPTTASRPPDLPGVTHRLEPARDGVRLHVAEAGDPDAPAVVLLHGWPQHWWMWRHLIPALAPEHRVLAVDLRGFGWSDAPRDGYRKDELGRDVLGLLDGLGVERAAFVGHDWGAVITHLLAGAAPERVDRAVLMSVPLRTRFGLRDLPGLRGFAHMPVLAAPLLGERAAASATFLRLVEHAGGRARDAWSAEDRALYLERFTEHPERARAAAQVYRTFVTREALSIAAAPRPQAPVLALHGAGDPVPASRSAQIIPGAGHWLAEERPAEVNERIRTFLAA